MPNPPEPDQPQPNQPGDPREGTTENFSVAPSDADTTVISRPQSADDPEQPSAPQRERRFTAPGFDANATQVIATAAEPETEVIHTPPPTPQVQAGGPPPQSGVAPKLAAPQSIPARDGGKQRLSSRRFNWGWVMAIIVVVLALAALAILGTVLLTRSRNSQVSQEDRVRSAIQSFDIAVQTGDLAKLRSITCGATRDSYAEYDDHAWQETYGRVAAAKQFPVIASIDQVAVNGQHAEANVTTFLADAPSVRSTRSLDLQFRDDQWKICQSPTG